MEKRDKKSNFPDIEEERMPVTKIIVKDLLRGKYREGYARPINWEAKPQQPKLELKELKLEHLKKELLKEIEENPRKKRNAIIIGTIALAAIFSVLAIMTIKIKSKQSEKIDTTVQEKITPEITQTLNDLNKSSAPEKTFVKEYLPKQNNTPVFYNEPIRQKYYRNGKEKIYTWVENGIRHYTNLEDVARSKNAVELQ